VPRRVPVIDFSLCYHMSAASRRRISRPAAAGHKPPRTAASGNGESAVERVGSGGHGTRGSFGELVLGRVGVREVYSLIGTHDQALQVVHAVAPVGRRPALTEEMHAIQAKR
jgi:hypothetical protein